MTDKNNTYPCEPILLPILTTVLVTLFAGCGPKNVRTIGSGVAPRNGHISKDDLREKLDKFSEYFKSSLRQMSNELNDRLKNKRTEKTTLQMRARMVQGLNAMMEHDDAVVAFVETWALCARFRIYLEEGEGSTLYGDAQGIAASGARRLETEIERVGHVFLKDDVFEATRKNVAEFANGNPIKGTFFNVIAYATEVRKDQQNPFMTVLKIPMSPFRAIEGVDRTAEAIHQFRNTAERFSDIVSELPESSRWQLQLLLYDLEETDITKSFLDSLTRLSESSSRLSKSSEELPRQIREQLDKFVEDIDSRQTNIQNTLQQAEKTTRAVNDTMLQLSKTADSLAAVAKDIKQTADAWETAAKATGEVVSQFNKIQQSKGDSSFDIKEYRATAEQVSQAANDLKDLLAVIEDFSKNRSYISVADALVLRVVGLIVLIFIMAVFYRIISRRPSRRKESRAA